MSMLTLRQSPRWIGTNSVRVSYCNRRKRVCYDAARNPSHFEMLGAFQCVTRRF